MNEKFTRYSEEEIQNALNYLADLQLNDEYNKNINVMFSYLSEIQYDFEQLVIKYNNLVDESDF